MNPAARPELVYDFPPKLGFLFTPYRYKGICGGRGKGASWGCARALLALGVQIPLRIVCARETQESISQSVHKLLSDQIQTMGLQQYYRILKQEIVGRVVQTEISFHGLKHNIDNIKSLEGADIVWVEEAATVSKDSWDKLIPTVRKDYTHRGLDPEPGHVCKYVGCCSEIWLTWNPELDTDDTHQRFIVNPPPNAKIVPMTWRDNPWFPEVLRIEMEHMRLTDPKLYAHVWEGQTRSSVEGAVYGDEIKATETAGRITTVPYDRTRPVHTFWDLGFGDKTAIWFGQAVDGWYHLIDYIEANGKELAWYLIQLQQRGYVYGTDWVPHDALDVMIHHRLGGDRSRSIEMLMRAAGRNVRLVPKMHVHEGINAVRTIFPQCRFDRDHCYEGLRALRMYQWGKPSPHGVTRREPLHDAASHGADAFRALALCLKQPEATPPPDPSFSYGQVRGLGGFR